MKKEDVVRKLSSRKFWIALAAFLASVGTSISGIATDNAAVATTGIVCTVLSAAIYQAAESYVDGKSAGSEQTINQVVTTKQVTASSTDKATVQQVLGTEAKEA